MNDGICDCCDGSDEYSSVIQCNDVCRELGKEAVLKAQRSAELARKGNKVRMEMVARGKQLKTEHQSRLSKLRADYDEAELSKKEKEVMKTRAEERENAALEKYKPEPQPDEPAGKVQEEGKEQTQREASEYFKLLDSDESGTVTIAELQTRVVFDKDRNGAVTDEEALFFLNNRDEITFGEFIEEAWPNIKPFLMLEKG